MSLAWEIDNDDPDDYRAVVVFAETQEEAAAKGASEVLSEPEVVRVQRTPWFDQFAEQGWVPASALFEHGWWLNCDFCDRPLNDDDDEQDDLDPVSPHFCGERSFCSEYCLNQWTSAKRRLAEEIQAVREQLVVKLPGIRIERVSGSWAIIHPIHVRFRFPGGKYWVEWDSDKPTEFQISKADVSAWQNYIKGLDIDGIQQELDSLS